MQIKILLNLYQNISPVKFWICCSGSYCDYLYTMFENGIIIEDFARGDAYDYDDRGQLKYFECYNEEKMVQDLEIWNINV